MNTSPHVEAPPTRTCDGYGPLLQRDYWAVLKHCDRSPREVAAFVAKNFTELAPEGLVTFTREEAASPSLREGDVLYIRIQLAGHCKVRVIHRDENSITVATLPGHPEAGRITFGSYRNSSGDVIFHIRSLARVSSRLKYIGFLLLGESMQTNAWFDFIDCLAASVGDGVLGAIQEETRKISVDPADENGPTYVAEGD